MNQVYGPLRVWVDNGVATVTIDHPPTNLVDGILIGGLIALLDACEDDPSVAVIVFTSADPDFFLMHGDVEAILSAPGSSGAGGAGGSGASPESVSAPNVAALTFDRLRTSGRVTIAALDGAARGGGAEFCSAVDLRYGTPRTVLGQPEVPMGILPGAGGTARLPRLLGRSRALDVMLTGRDVTADEALSIGWLDGVVPSASLARHVAGVARRIAAMPRASVAAVKQVVDVSLGGSLGDGLLAESRALARLLASGAHRDPMTRFLAGGGQTREGEVARWPAIVDGLLDR